MKKIFELLNTNSETIDIELAETGMDFIVIDGEITDVIKETCEEHMVSSIYNVKQDGKIYQVHSTIVPFEKNNSCITVYEL